MSAASGTIFTFSAGPSLLGSPGSLAAPGNFVALPINIGLLGVAVQVTGVYVGVISVQVSLDHGMTYQEIDTINSQQLTKIYTFPQNGPLLYTDFRLSGKTWTTGNALINILPWNPLAVPTIIGSNGVPQPAHSADKFFTAAFTLAGNNAIWTPAAGKRFRLLWLYARCTLDSSLATSADMVADFRDGNASIGVAGSFYIPAAPTQNFPPEVFTQDLGSIGYLSSAVGNVLNLNLSVALKTGQCRVNVQGTEE
jgi:hypothetical protein